MNKKQQAQAIAEGTLINELVEQQKQDLYAAWIKQSPQAYGEGTLLQSQARALEGILWQLKESAKAFLDE